MKSSNPWLTIDFQSCESAFADLYRHSICGSNFSVRIGYFFPINRHGGLCTHAFGFAAGLDKFAGKQKLFDRDGFSRHCKFWNFIRQLTLGENFVEFGGGGFGGRLVIKLVDDRFAEKNLGIFGMCF